MAHSALFVCVVLACCLLLDGGGLLAVAEPDVNGSEQGWARDDNGGHRQGQSSITPSAGDVVFLVVKSVNALKYFNSLRSRRQDLPSVVDGSGSAYFDEETEPISLSATDGGEGYAASGDEEGTAVSPMSTPSHLTGTQETEATANQYPKDSSEVAASSSQSQSSEKDSSSSVSPATTSPPLSPLPSSSSLPPSVDEPPRLRDRLAKVSLEVGAVFSLRVPDAIFSDREDGGTHQLRLRLTAADRQLSSDHWLQLKQEEHRIYALPKEEDVGEYKYQLVAIDSAGQRATGTMYVSVRQFRQWRTVNHHFMLSVKLNNAKQFPIDIDWQLLLMKRIENMMAPNNTSDSSDSTSDSVRMYRVDRSLPGQPVQVTWFNRSLSTHQCDLPALRRIASRLRDESGAPSAELRAVLAPEFIVKRVSVKLMQLCSGSRLGPAGEDGGGAPAGGDKGGNSPPYRRRPLDLIETRVGRLLQLQIPADTFHDGEDGGTRSLHVHLLTDDRQRVPADHWLRFESNNQEFIGVPLEHDVGISHYHLECVDSAGLTVTDSIEVHVLADARLSLAPSVQFSVTLAAAFDRFTADSLRLAVLVQRVGRLFGDPRPDSVVVTALRRGSVIVEWRNASLPSERCAGSATVTALRRRLLDDSGRVTAAARAELAPQFELMEAAVVPRGVCLAAAAPTRGPASAPVPSSRAPPGATPTLHARVHEYLSTFVVPGLVIALLLLLAGLVACVLLRVRRKRHKLGAQREAADYVSRGVPVIFADELPVAAGRQTRRTSDQSGALETWRRQRCSAPPEDGSSVPMLDVCRDGDRSGAAPRAAAGSRHASLSPFLDRQPPPYTPDM